uniref:NADH-ubiquinone oxidoreductase chain 5 n=1 Tax=Marphysa sanguinea TaxID=167828 RepID=V5W4Q6_MARSA|nr:NADH dehydrogenase subunit 5 [Marphysa sanguinea]AHC01838.1 NADH dehydrogenase subunit 5 [Marphysa sanguinea]
MLLKSTPKISSLIIWLLLSLTIIPMMFFFIFMNTTILIQWNLISIFSMHISLPLILDPVGLLFSFIVLFISANIMQFSSSYMAGDPLMKRFIHLVLLFILSMNMLIYIPHLMFLLLGWDGLGITSFILVIYYQNPKSLAAGMITALTNRIGDALILLSIAWMLNQGHWLILQTEITNFSPPLLLAITLAALTKSAQIPFSSWLPAAMAAPTPVSALVHSSTLVTAGVFLLIRFYPALSMFPNFHTLLLLTASLTMFMAGLSAMFESDMKKIIALSTLSQLGVMMASLGLALPSLALFHLSTHALFKALLFMCAGFIISSMHHAQDLRILGALTNQMPLLLSSMTVANLALCGTPFLAGFYSKDMILELSVSNPSNILILTLLFISTALTSAYSIRFMISLVWSPSMSNPLHQTNNKDLDISIPTILLSTGAIFGGTMMSWMMFPSSPEPFIPLQLKLLAILFTATGGLLSASLITAKTKIPFNPMTTLMYHLSASMWFLTPLSSQFLMKRPLLTSMFLLKTIDSGWNETLGGQGTKLLSSSLSAKAQPWQNNMITSHLTLMSLTLLLLLLI